MGLGGGRRRFTALLDQAAQDGAAPVIWTDTGPQARHRTSPGEVIGCLLLALIASTLLTLLIIGLITALDFLSG